MAQVPSYEEIRANKEKARLMQEFNNNRQSVGQNVALGLENSKNPVLEAYMNKQKGLGEISPAQYVNNATAMSQGRNQEEYSTAMINAAVNGQIDPMEVLNDPSVLDSEKNILLSLMQGTGNELPSQGLGNIQ